MKKNSQASIGRALGLSGASMTKLKKLGMPTDTADNARAWRADNIRTSVQTPALSCEVEKFSPPDSDAVSRVHTLMNIASAAMACGQSIDYLVPMLRDALKNVPERERDAVLMHPGVMDVLTADVSLLLDCDVEVDTLIGEFVPDTVANYMGCFWYRVAAGEVQPGGISS